MATAQSGQSSLDQDQPLFYKKQIILKSVMDRLGEKGQKTLDDMKIFNDKVFEVHPELAGSLASSHKDQLGKCLTRTKPSKLEKIAIYDSNFDKNLFTLDKLYDDWHNILIDIAKSQHKNAKDIVDNWFKELEKVDIEDAFDFEEESSENGEEPTDESASNAKWFLWLAAICSVASLFSYNNADVKECVNRYSQCWRNITLKTFGKIYKYYTEFHGITTENELQI